MHPHVGPRYVQMSKRNQYNCPRTVYFSPLLCGPTPESMRRCGVPMAPRQSSTWHVGGKPAYRSTIFSHHPSPPCKKAYSNGKVWDCHWLACRFANEVSSSPRPRHRCPRPRAPVRLPPCCCPRSARPRTPGGLVCRACTQRPAWWQCSSSGSPGWAYSLPVGKEEPCNGLSGGQFDFVCSSARTMHPHGAGV